MNKKIGFGVVGLVLLAIIIYFFNSADKEPEKAKTPTIEKQIKSTQAIDKEKQISNKNSPADSLRNALQNVVQDSIEQDIQEAVQSEVAKSQK
ncbi:MAG TPA: hypothetical protein EYG68_10690 [Leucothrix mucor]|nr:hypothetical protein [Leucothrix mucor]